MKLFNIFKRNTEKNANGTFSYFLTSGNNISATSYDDPKLAIEGYIKNIIVYRAITLITDQLKMGVFKQFNKKTKKEIDSSEILDLLKNPYPTLTRADFLERVGTHKFIYGNYYIELVKNPRGGDYNTLKPFGLFPMRPDWITIHEGNNALVHKYDYTPDRGAAVYFPVGLTGKANLIHGMLYNPSDDYHGLSPIVPAGYSIDTHNSVGKMNFNFIENGARPSGILTVPKEVQLGPEQFNLIKQQLDDIHTGSENRGRPMLLKGGITWTQISTNSKDGDFTEMKQAAAREIGLAFGMSPDLLENAKYDNLHSAYEQLYHDKVIPTAQALEDQLNSKVVPLFDKNAEIKIDYSHTKTMQESRIKLMDSLNPITFLTDNEKRERCGIDAAEWGDEQPNKKQQITPQMNEYISEQMADGLTYNEALKAAQIIF